ncbi:hypothetical protein [Streptomyces torulosus]|uniref:hypothetical protein n=1 Tax=Streptomyces torulosus TaxID=68276 RepID=UPI0006EB355F|nr:hypothetical protein [Streptomyces torulosus]
MPKDIDFYPAPRPVWVLFNDEEGVTFSLMPGWAAVENDDGIRWTTLTRQNLHNFEAESLDTDEHNLIRMWDLAVHGAPTLEDVLDAVRARHHGATASELEAAEADYRMFFNMPPARGNTAESEAKP